MARRRRKPPSVSNPASMADLDPALAQRESGQAASAYSDYLEELASPIKGGASASAGGKSAVKAVPGRAAIDASRGVFEEASAFLKGKEKVLRETVFGAIKSGKFDESKAGGIAFAKSFGLPVDERSLPILSPKGGVRAPGPKVYQSILSQANDLLKGGVKPKEVYAHVANAVGLIGAATTGKEKYIEGIKNVLASGQKTALGSLGKGVAAGIGIAFGLQMLTDPLLEAFVREPRETKRAREAADMTAEEMLTDYEMAELIDSQAVSALSRFPSTAQGLLGRMSGGGQQGGGPQTPQNAGPALPGEMYIPAGTPPQEQGAEAGMEF